MIACSAITPSGASSARAALEVGAEVLPADRLDHLDRDELVVAPAQLAVVVAAGRSRGPRAPPRAPAASANSRCSRDRVVVVTRQPRVEAACTREAAPAGPDLEHVVGRPEVELVADPLELRPRGLGERHVAPLEDRARVHHRLVEHQLEQRVAEVVVGGDVLAGAQRRVALQQRAAALPRLARRASARAGCGRCRAGCARRPRSPRSRRASPRARRRRSRPGPCRRAPAPARRPGRGRPRSPAGSRSRTRGGQSPSTRVSWPDSIRSSRAITSLRATRSIIKRPPCGDAGKCGTPLSFKRDAVGVDQGERAQRGADQRAPAQRPAAQVQRRVEREPAVAMRLDVHRERLAGLGGADLVGVVHGHERRDVERLVHRAAARAEDVAVLLAPRRVRDLGDDRAAARRR